MLDRTLMVCLHLKHHIQHAGSGAVMFQTDLAKSYKVAAVYGIPHLDVIGEYFQFRQGDSKVIIGYFVKDMFFSEGFQLVVIPLCFVGLPQSVFGKPPDREWCPRAGHCSTVQRKARKGPRMHG